MTYFSWLQIFLRRVEFPLPPSLSLSKGAKQHESAHNSAQACPPPILVPPPYTRACCNVIKLRLLSHSYFLHQSFFFGMSIPLERHLSLRTSTSVDNDPKRRDAAKGDRLHLIQNSYKSSQTSSLSYLRHGINVAYPSVFNVSL